MSSQSAWSAIAPGKLILSGEHAVVYGAPALACAIARYTQVDFHTTDTHGLTTQFAGVAKSRYWQLAELEQLQQQLDLRFDEFSQGKRSIGSLLDSPDQLLTYALCYQAYQYPQGTFSSHSSLPTGAGMGSSAAAIAATRVLAEELNSQPTSLEQRIEAVRFVERLQHGRGSVMDAATVVLGGVVSVQQGVAKRSTLSLGEGWYWLYSGAPAASTGEVVASVAEQYAGDDKLWQRFNDTTEALMTALANREASALTGLLQQNQQLLESIGVVPSQACELIRLLAKRGAVAKVSGAGSHKGDGAGLMIVYAPGVAPEALFTGLDFPWGALELDTLGARQINTGI